SQKWPSRAPDGVALLRAFLRDGAGASDDEMVGVARAELREVLGIEAAPLFVRVTRRERALPIYEVGHPGRVAAIEARVAAHGALALAGNAYRGLGIPDCIASGEAAAEAALAACA
ncbi:MAG TPA: FAD-dependent oxidoreductase, partial [Sandaracinaceae bacterium]